MKEIISLHIGQAGVQTGMTIWELFCAEHCVNCEGSLCDDVLKAEGMETFFQKTSINTYVPRSLFVDLEPSVVDEIRCGTYKKLFHPDRLLSGPEDAANNFARGFFTVGKLLLGNITSEFRHLIEQCEMVKGMIILRSLGGGTGAGLTSAMFEVLSDYSKTPKIEVPIYPSPKLSTSMVEPYNCLLGEHFCMEDIDVGLLLDNEAMFDMCSRYLNANFPTYNTINRLISQIASSITASIRFENVLNCDLTVLQTNLVPYPRIHFPLCNFAPILSYERADHSTLSVLELTRMVFDSENQMMKVDQYYGKFMSCALFYRGSVSPHHVYKALSEIKKDKSIEFVDWCPTGFKVGINAMTPCILPESLLADTGSNVAMLTNTSAVGQAWQRLTHRFFLLYSKRSFIHWFVGEGMEECEFTEALYNISALVKDYEEAGDSSALYDFIEQSAYESGANNDKEPENSNVILDIEKSDNSFNNNSEQKLIFKPNENNRDINIDINKFNYATAPLNQLQVGQRKILHNAERNNNDHFNSSHTYYKDDESNIISVLDTFKFAENKFLDQNNHESLNENYNLSYLKDKTIPATKPNLSMTNCYNNSLIKSYSKRMSLNDQFSSKTDNNEVSETFQKVTPLQRSEAGIILYSNDPFESIDETQTLESCVVAHSSDNYGSFCMDNKNVSFQNQLPNFKSSETCAKNKINDASHSSTMSCFKEHTVTKQIKFSDNNSEYINDQNNASEIEWKSVKGNNYKKQNQYIGYQQVNKTETSSKTINISSNINYGIFKKPVVDYNQKNIDTIYKSPFTESLNANDDAYINDEHLTLNSDSSDITQSLQKENFKNNNNVNIPRKKDLGINSESKLDYTTVVEIPKFFKLSKNELFNISTSSNSSTNNSCFNKQSTNRTKHKNIYKYDFKPQKSLSNKLRG